MHKYLVRFARGVPFCSGAMRGSLQPGTRLPKIVLHSDYKLYRVLEGAALWRVNSRIALVTRSGDFFVLPPFTPVEISARGEVVIAYCHFDFRPVPGHVRGSLAEDCAGGPEAGHVPIAFTSRQAPRVAREFSRLLNVPLDTPGSWRVEERTLALVRELARFGKSVAARSPNALILNAAHAPDARVECLRRRIDAEPARRWSIAMLAAEIGLSRSHLAALCQKSMGRSLKRYLVESRLRAAMRLLKPADGEPPTIRAVSERTGFSSQHLFCRTFKRAYGIAPLKYRNAARALLEM